MVELYTSGRRATVPEGKNVSVSFRVSPRFKTLLEAAAARERRSLTNMLETLLFAYCEQQGIEAAIEPNGTVKPPKRGVSK
jgi:hypothetical protein